MNATYDSIIDSAIQTYAHLYPDAVVNPHLYWVNHLSPAESTIIMAPDSTLFFGNTDDGYEAAFIFEVPDTASQYLGFGTDSPAASSLFPTMVVKRHLIEAEHGLRLITLEPTEGVADPSKILGFPFSASSDRTVIRMTW